MTNSAPEFLAAMQKGTADKGACLVIWRLLKFLRTGAKIDMAEPQCEWSVKLKQSPDARYMNLFAEGYP